MTGERLATAIRTAVNDEQMRSLLPTLALAYLHWIWRLSTRSVLPACLTETLHLASLTSATLLRLV